MSNDPIAALRARKKELTGDQRKAFDSIIRESKSPEEAWQKVSKVKWGDSKETALNRGLGAFAQLGRAPLKVVEGGLDIAARAAGGAGTKPGKALSKARNFMSGQLDQLESVDPSGGIAGKAAEVAKIGGHAALAGLTGGGSSAAVKGISAGSKLGKAGAFLRAGKKGSGLGATLGKAAREGTRQALRTAPMTVALSGGDSGGLASSALGVKNKWGRAALDVAEDATFGTAVDALAAGKNIAQIKKAKLAEQAKRAKEVAGDTGDMPLPSPKGKAPKKAAAQPKAAEPKKETRAEAKARRQAEHAAARAKAEADRLAAKEAAGGKKGGKKSAKAAPAAAKAAPAPTADTEADDIMRKVQERMGAKPDAPATPPKTGKAKAAPKGEPEAPKASKKAEAPEVAAARDRYEEAEVAYAKARDAKLANPDTPARRQAVRDAKKAVNSTKYRYEQAAAKAADGGAAKATGGGAAKASKAEAASTSDRYPPGDPRHGMTKAERSAYNKAKFAEESGAREAEWKAKKAAAEASGEAPAKPKKEKPVREGQPIRPRQHIGTGEAGLSPRTQAALDAEEAAEQVKESIGKPAPTPTKPNTANLSPKEKAELKRLKKEAPKAPKPDKTLLSKMPDEELVALRSKLLREQETKMGGERPARGAWEAVDKEWQARKTRRAATKKATDEKVAEERKAAGKRQPEVERPPLAPKGTVKRRRSFNEGDGAQEARPVATASQGAEETDIEWRLRLHRETEEKVAAAQAQAEKVRADRRATLAQNKAAREAVADARAAEKQAAVLLNRAKRGIKKPAEVIYHSSPLAKEVAEETEQVKTQLDVLKEARDEADKAANAKPMNADLQRKAIAAAKALRDFQAASKREGGQVVAGAAVGGVLGGAGDASASDGSEDTTSLAERVGVGMLTGAGAGFGLRAGWRKLKGAPTRNVTKAAAKVLSEEQRIMALPAKQRAAARAAARAGNNPMAPADKVTHMGPAYADPNEPIGKAGGKTARDLFNVNREGFDQLPADSRARLATLLIEQLTTPAKESAKATRRAAAKLLATLPEELVKGIDPKVANRAQTVAVATHMLEIHKSMDLDLKRLNSGGLSRRERSALKDVIDRKAADEVRLARLLQAAGTETARDLNAFKLIAHATSPGMFVVKMEKLLRRELLPDEADRMRAFLAANDREGAIQYAMSLNKPGWLSKLVHGRNTGLLAGVPGRVKDVISSVSHMGLETLTQPAAALIDRKVGKVIGQRMRDAGMQQSGSLRSVTTPDAAQMKAMLSGLGMGAKKFVNESLGLDAMRKAVPGRRFAAWTEEMQRTKLTAEQLAARDLPNVISYDTKGIDVYTKFVQRTTAGVDNIAKSGALESEKHNMARVLAAQDVADGVVDAADEAKQVAKYIKSPTTEMELAMAQFARSVTFQNKGVAAAMARVVKQDLPRAVSKFHPALGEAMSAVVNMVVPFATTGANISARLLDYTPVGALRGAAYMKLIMNDLAEGRQLTTELIRQRQRDVVEAFGRSVVGTGVLLGAGGMGYNLYKEGLLTGQTSKDPSKRETDEAAGRLPNSINFGGHWIPIGQYSPIGNLLTVGATLARAVDEGEVEEPKNMADLSRMLTLAWVGEATSIRSVLEQPIVTGVKSALDAAQDPVGQATNYVGQMAGSLVPTFVNDIANATDGGRSRMIDRTTLTGNMGGNIARRIPGVRQLLPKDYDVLGGEVRTRRGGLLTTLLPIHGMRDRANDPTKPEAQALWAAGGGLRLPRREKNESLRDYSERTRITGEEIRRVLQQRLGGAQVEWPTNQEEREDLQDWVRESASIGRRRAKPRLRDANVLPPRK